MFRVLLSMTVIFVLSASFAPTDVSSREFGKVVSGLQPQRDCTDRILMTGKCDGPASIRANCQLIKYGEKKGAKPYTSVPQVAGNCNQNQFDDPDPNAPNGAQVNCYDATKWIGSGACQTVKRVPF